MTTTQPAPRIVYSPDYDIHYMGMEKLHPFDTRKYSRAYKLLHAHFGEKLKQFTVAPAGPVSDDDLLLVHTADYLEQLQSMSYLAGALEFPPVKLFPRRIVEKHLIAPMRLATQGTIQAAELALANQIVVNLGGGYHHASQAKGEGFCLFADVSIAIQKLRATGKLNEDDSILIVDLDVHQGNGHERVHTGDHTIIIFDMYNKFIYPGDKDAKQAITFNVSLQAALDDEQYLSTLKTRLPEALQTSTAYKLAFYIAGTDIYDQDLLGNMQVSEAGVLARDRYVIDSLVQAGVPVVVVTAGGYSGDSYRMIASMVQYIFETYHPEYTLERTTDEY